jgi:hypothetical protein
MSITNLNDRWSRVAALATERPEPKPQKVFTPAGQAPPETIPKVSAAAVQKFTVRNVTEADKSGAAAVIENGVRAQWMDVTPAMAARWLKVNFRNRPVSDHTVKAYARDMQAGVWHQTHQGIAFNDRDELIDGQHRLLAVVAARRTVRLMVTFGLRSQIEGSAMTTMDCVDRGRTRSVADQLKIQHGLKTGTQIVQVATALAGFCHESIRRPSVDQVLKIYHWFKPEMDFVIANRSTRHGLRGAGVLAGFAFALATENGPVHERPAAKMFVSLVWGDDVAEGKRLDAFPAIKQLHAFLTGATASMLMASMNRGIADLTLQALWLESKHSTEKLEMKLDGRNFFREKLGDRVAKVAALFELPKQL